MWMDAYVQQTLIRQQIAESDRIAALRHLLGHAARPARRRSWWSVRLLVRRLAARWPRRPAARVAVR